MKMAIKTTDGYECGYCHRFYTNPIDADNCKNSHNLIYVAITREELNNLLSFIFLKEEALLSDRLVERLQGYLKNSLIEEENDSKSS